MNSAQTPRPVQFIALPDAHGRLCPDWLRTLGEQADPPVQSWQPPRGQRRDWRRLLAGLKTLPVEGPILVLRSGLKLPSDWRQRLDSTPAGGDPLPRLPLGNYADMLNPIAGLDVAARADTIDDWLWLCAAHQSVPINDFPLDCLYLPAGAASALSADAPALLLDHLFVIDPDRPLDAGHTRHPAAQAALGPVRLRLKRLLGEAPEGPAPRPGRDGRPVTLHISHDWGGGVARWIDDLVATDSDGHHLVLSASGDQNGTVHGQHLRLYAAGPGRGLVQEHVLSPAIADSVCADSRYRTLLQALIQRFSVGRILVSSLIGHSLDALETGLPTAHVLHDCYPAWPLLDRDPLDWRAESSGEIELDRALAERGSDPLFQNDEADHWLGLGAGWLERVRRCGVQLIAPSFEVLRRWQALSKDALPEAQVIGHGFRGWQQPPAPVIGRARPDGRLNLVVVGRISPGKGLRLLDRALSSIQPMAHITLLGCGPHGERFLGRAGVDLVFEYEHVRLPELLARLGPQAALFLSTVPETWNYALSEVRSLGIIPVATRLGSFVERIRHGRDGWLFDPQPDALIERIQALHAAPEQLAELEHRPPETSLKTVIQRYWQLLPASPGPLAISSLPGPARVDQGRAHAELASTETRLTALAAQRDQLEQELITRADWATRYERLSAERTRWAQSLEGELEKTRADMGDLSAQHQAEQTAHAATRATLAAAIAEWTEKLRLSQDELEATQRQRLQAESSLSHAEQELALVLGSRSWRWTRPLRFVNRSLEHARRQQAMNPLHWPRLLRRLIHSLRFQGWRGTLQRVQGTAAPIDDRPVLEAVAVPDETACQEPVTLPHAAQPRASIIIPVYNKLAYTAACLHSIAAEAGPTSFEVIVVDDCSSDASADFLADCPGLVVVSNDTNSGFIASCNAGAERARGDFLVFLNNDTTVTTGWLEALLRTFEDFDAVGIAGARLVYPDGRLQEAGGIIFSDASGWNYGRGQSPDEPQYQFASEADYVSGACLAIRRELFSRLGGFDRHYAPAYYEDTDLCFRVREEGLRVYCQPACTIIHHEGVSSGTDESSGTKRYQAVNRDKFSQRWAEQLRRQPPPPTDPSGPDPVRAARFHRARGRALLIDATTPMPDHDSGSVRFTALLELILEQGWQVSFMPQNLVWEGRYSSALQRRGIEVLSAPVIRSLEPWLREHGESLDLVLVSRHYVLEPLIKLLRKSCPRARLVFDTVDLHFLREQRQAELSGSASMQGAAARTRATELALMRDSDVTLVVSPVEQALLAELVPEARIEVLSNIHSVAGRQQDWAPRRDLMFVGGFQHPPNVDAAEWLIDDIFPRIRAQLPEVQLHLIGSRMPEALRERAGDGVRVHGFVEDLTPYLNGCRLSLAPLRYGAGVKGKVNQAMAWGLPVVATRCAAEGMFLVHGEDVLIADEAAHFAAETIRAYQDEALWLTLSEGGLANVERHFSRAAAGRVVAELLASAPDRGQTS